MVSDMVAQVRLPLPIDEHLDAIVAAVQEHGGAVVVAEPGAGKTTKVPGALLDRCQMPVYCTQPRRMAARLSALRVAKERGSSIGGQVGYEVRFDRKVSKATQLRFMTEGVALRQWKKQLGQKRILVLDEFHERNLDVDMLLAMAAQERNAGSPLAIVVMSATLDPGPVSEFLGGVPIVASSGRAFPIEHSYQAPRDGEYLEVQVSRALRSILKNKEDGDVLVFLPGVGEISRCQRKLEELGKQYNLAILPLHGGLRPAEQDLALRSSPKKKIILATNVAETSVTIDGVTCVIDCGTARIASHSPWTGLSSLQVSPVSQASIAQRAGRAGRTAPGHCVHLYTQLESQRRPSFETPEILRSELSAAALHLASVGSRLGTLQWLQAPPEEAQNRAELLLETLGATQERDITELGKAMGTLPLHPRLARLVLEAQRFNIAGSGARAAGLLSQRSLRHSQRKGNDATSSSTSDVLDDLDILEELAGSGFRAQVARAADADLQTAKTAEKTAEQVLKSLRSRGDDPRISISERDTLLRHALLAGFPDRVGRRVQRRKSSILLSRGGAVNLSASSSVLDAQYLLAIDVESRGQGSRRTATIRVASEIDPEWLLDLDGITDMDSHDFESEKERVVRRMGIYYGDIAVDEERIVDPSRLDADKARQALKAALLDGKIHKVVDTKDLRGYSLRMQFVASHNPGMAWPTLDDECIADALLSMADRPTRFSDLRNGSLVDALHWSLTEEQRKALGRMAPTHVAIPGRKRVEVHYESDRPPWIQSRLQDFFGALEGPSVADGRVPLTLHLLAPNRRAVQVTTDLAGFWVRHYPALRKQLMRRYPRHKWPETP